MIANRLGQGLVKAKLIDAKQLERLLEDAKNKKRRLIDALIAESLVDERRLIAFLSKAYALPTMDLASFELNHDITHLLDPKFCTKYGVLPISVRGDTLVIAVYDPTNIQLIDEVRFRTRLKVEQILALPSSIRSLLEKYFGANINDLVQDIGEDDDLYEEEDDDGSVEDNDAPIVNFVSALFVDAIRKRASDIHIEPYENDLRVRFRIDGKLINAAKPNYKIRKAIVARIKVMAKMRLDEKRLPQDGRILFKLPEGTQVDFRVNSLPTVYGEKVVLRILDRSKAAIALEELDFEKSDIEKLKKAVKLPWGICLVTGPTGSGKTTTLYAALNWLNNETINISTIEEPVEYNFKGINQVNVREKIGLSFGSSLRALLRQDPDVILLGEIRDADTAKTAMQAALTGHMVLSTLHTNDAPSTLMRLMDMGVDPFLVNSTIQLVLAQRLLRRICKHCKTVDKQYSSSQLVKMGFPKNVVERFKPMKGEGCDRCSGSGFSGRLAVVEVMQVTDAIREIIPKEPTTLELRKLAIKEGMSTLRINAMKKVIKGVTTVEEMQRLTMSAEG